MKVKTILLLVAEAVILSAGLSAVGYAIGSMREPKRIPRNEKEVRDSRCCYRIDYKDGVPYKVTKLRLRRGAGQEHP